MELKDYLRILRRRWVSILFVMLVGGGLAASYAYTQTKQYSSSVRLFITSPPSTDAASSTLNSFQTSAMSVQSFANVVGSQDLAKKVAQGAHVDIDPRVLAKEVKATVVNQTVTLTITVTDADPARAQKLADGYAKNMVAMVGALSTPPGSKIASIKATIYDGASFSDSPVSPNPRQDIALGLVVGLLVGFGLAVLRDVLDTRIRGTEVLASVTDNPILGTIAFDNEAKKKPLVTDIQSHAPRAEAFRVLRTNLQFVDVDSTNKVFVITSSVPTEGKTSTSVNLALSLAQTGIRTLLIEGDLRRPRAAVMLGFDNAVGVTSVLVGKVAFENALQHEPTSGLDFIASGPIPPNPAELLQSHAMGDLIDKARSSYDVVLIDAPPLLPVTDAALISVRADGAILIVRHGRTTRDQVHMSQERLDHVDAKMVGLVLNMVPLRARGYGYGYGYGYAPETTTKSGARVPALVIDQSIGETALPAAAAQSGAQRVGRGKRVRTSNSETASMDQVRSEQRGKTLQAPDGKARASDVSVPSEQSARPRRRRGRRNRPEPRLGAQTAPEPLEQPSVDAQ